MTQKNLLLRAKTQRTDGGPRAIEMASHSWHALDAQAVSANFGTDIAVGLDEQQVRERLAQFGPNQLREQEREPIWKIYLEELREPLILLLIFTGVLYAIWGELLDALTIFLVILTLNAIEVLNEYRASQAIAALRKLAEPIAIVRRDGHSLGVPVEDLVPGDVLLLEAGRSVPADARLVEAFGLAANESPMTGESVPVEKQAEGTLPEKTALAERRNMLFAGTAITRGKATAVVVTTGAATELGHIAELTRDVESPRTPLQQAMGELSRSLVFIALGFSVIVPLLGWLLTTQPLQQLILTGLSLAFATIPEEMPIIITMTLALGAYRLSRRKAIAKNLKAVETLGAVTVIATDKTGTLTENRMQVNRFVPEPMTQKLLEDGVLCNDASDEGAAVGDPMETALLEAARANGMDVRKYREAYPLQNEFTFDNVRKASNLANEGLRVLAFAEKTLSDGAPTQAEAESGLTFVGFAALFDPPRSESKDAIAASRRAGIRPLMITGDHPLTARAIANQVGLESNGRVLTGGELDALSEEALQEMVSQVSIYARTTPEHKLRIVRALQARGERVAVTGDGINDAPALAAADIGVAMGETGTDVAREAADLVRADDNYATIISAVEEGRILYENLKKAVRYYLTCKVALVTATLLPVLLRAPVPFAPIQIILMELFMDLAASATFVVEPPEAGLMERPPRNPQARFMDRAMITSIFRRHSVYLPRYLCPISSPITAERVW